MVKAQVEPIKRAMSALFLSLEDIMMFTPFEWSGHQDALLWLPFFTTPLFIEEGLEDYFE
jgi:hypothetical protein